MSSGGGGTIQTSNEERPVWERLKGWDRTFAQMWEIAFGPELERRKTAGLIGNDFHLYMAQLLLPPEEENRVLFNEEVRGTALMRAPSPIWLTLNSLSYRTTYSTVGISLSFAPAEAGGLCLTSYPVEPRLVTCSN